MNQINIIPYVGVGDLKFGMRQEEVADILGAADSSLYDDDSNLITEYRLKNGLQASFDRSTGRLVLISIYSNIEDVSLGQVSIDWSNTKKLFADLLTKDASAKGASGIAVFFKYGISAVGLLGNEVGNKSITAFDAGQWQEDDSILKPLRHPT